MFHRMSDVGRAHHCRGFNNESGDVHRVIGGLSLDQNTLCVLVAVLDELREINCWVRRQVDEAARGRSDSRRAAERECRAVSDGRHAALMKMIGPFPAAAKKTAGANPPVFPRGRGVRVAKAILKSGCTTPEEVAAFGAERLLEIRGCGVTTLNAIRDWLREDFHLTLRESCDAP